MHICPLKYCCIFVASEMLAKMSTLPLKGKGFKFKLTICLTDNGSLPEKDTPLNI